MKIIKIQETITLPAAGRQTITNNQILITKLYLFGNCLLDIEIYLVIVS